MNEQMTFEQAVRQMTQGNNADDVREALFDAVWPLVHHQTHTAAVGLWDWLYETSGFDGTETPESLAAEFNGSDDDGWELEISAEVADDAWGSDAGE